jgi:hypothetical protein
LQVPCYSQLRALTPLQCVTFFGRLCVSYRNEATVLSVLYVFIRQQQRRHVITQSQRSRSQ